MKIGEGEEGLRVGDVAHVSGGFSVLGFAGSGSALRPPPPRGGFRAAAGGSTQAGGSA